MTPSTNSIFSLFPPSPCRKRRATGLPGELDRPNKEMRGIRQFETDQRDIKGEKGERSGHRGVPRVIGLSISFSLTGLKEWGRG